MIKRKDVCRIGLTVMALIIGLSGVSYGTTIATFFDPAPNGNVAMFTVMFGTNGTVSAGWPDSMTNLTLQVPVLGPTINYPDAWFTMTTLTYSGGSGGGTTSAGTVTFYADNTTSQLATVSFSTAQISPGGLYGDDVFYANGVVITVTGLSQPLMNEQFAFSFANKKPIIGASGAVDGYTATASFTSSAVIVPEPLTLVLLSLGSLVVLKRRKIA